MELKKEIHFLKNIRIIIESGPENLDALFSQFAGILPEAFSRPGEIRFFLEFDGNKYGTEEALSHRGEIDERIHASGEPAGRLIVRYASPELSFTQDERELLRYVTARLGRVAERYGMREQNEDLLRKHEEKNGLLKDKDAALSELLRHGFEVMQNSKKNTTSLIRQSIIPNLHKLEEQIGSNFYLELIKLTVSGLITDEEKVLYNFSQLSQRELECCYLINKGLSSKEIAIELHLSTKTVERHRANIRKKLGIVGQKKNLFASLQFIDQS